MNDRPTSSSAVEPLVGKSLILFDGVCNLCNGSVRFVLKRDRHDRFRFAPLQSEVAHAYLPGPTSADPALSSMILVEDGQVYMRSDAALRIARRLTGGWPLLYGLMVLPRFLRDGLYNFIARHRYAWFGKRSTCMVPNEDVAHRFLE